MSTQDTDSTTAGGVDAGVALNAMGWDAVYATTFAKVNEWLSASGKLPQGFERSDGDSGTATGRWAGWALINGSPSNLLWAQCSVAGGSFQTPHGTYDLTGSTWTVQFGLTLTPEASQPGGAMTLSLTPAMSGPGAPRLISYAAPNVSGQDAYVLQEIMNKVLRDEVLALGTSFMSISLNDPGSAPDQPWLIPTAADFACESLPAGDPRVGVFAVLAMTEGRSPSGNQAAVDRRVLDGAPAGTDAALVIGPRLLIEQLLTPATRALVQGAGPGDFTNNGTTVYNVADMTWGAFTYEEKGGNTSTVHPRVPKGNIQLSLDGEVMHLSMVNINFPYPGWKGPGEITIAFNTEQFITFDFILRDDGGLVMVPQTGKFNTAFHVTVIPDQTVLEFQMALDAALEILMAVIGEVVESAAEAVTEATSSVMSEGAEGGFEAEMGMSEVDELVGNNASAEEVEEIEEGAAEQGGEAVANEGDAGYLQKFKSAIIANKWKIIMKVVEEMVTVPAGKTTEIAVWMAEKQYDQLPSLNTFAAAGVKSVKWADGSTLTLTGGSLRGALVLWGTIGA